MFTQTEPRKPTIQKPNTSSKPVCDGCPKNCTLSAQQGYNVFVPTIAGTPIYSYIDTNGTKALAVLLNKPKKPLPYLTFWFLDALTNC